MAGASASPLSAISGNAAPSDGTATSGAKLSAKTRDTPGRRSPGGLRQLCAPYQRPPAVLATACTAISVPPSSAAPCSDAKAVIASSAAPTAIPTPRAPPISTQTAADRRGPIRPCSAGAPRHVRDARDVANTVDPSSDRPMQTDSDAVGEASAITAAAIRGSSDEGDIDRNSVEGERGLPEFALRDEIRPERPHGGARGDGAKSGEGAGGAQDGDRCPVVSEHDQTRESHCGERRGRQNHPRLSDPIHHPALDRQGDCGGNGVGGHHGTRRRKRTGRAVHEQHRRERLRRDRKPPDDDAEQRLLDPRGAEHSPVGLGNHPRPG